MTAAGELVRADANTNSDLYWAARGAGPGFFGVVTRFHVPTTLDVQRVRQLHDNPEGHRWAVDNAWLAGPAADVVPAMRRAYTTLG